MKKKDTKEPQVEKKDPTGAYLWITLSGFVLLWFAAMQYLSIFDAFVVFGTIFCASIGSLRGGIKEFFSFFGVVASFLIAINGYLVFHNMTGFNFWTNNNFWGKLGWFLLLLGSGWITCRFLSHYLQNLVIEMASLQYFNRILGATLGGLKGVILGYVFIIVMMGVEVPKKTDTLSKQFEISYAHRSVEILENRYHFLENLENIELADKMQIFLKQMNRYFAKH